MESVQNTILWSRAYARLNDHLDHDIAYFVLLGSVATRFCEFWGFGILWISMVQFVEAYDPPLKGLHDDLNFVSPRIGEVCAWIYRQNLESTLLYSRILLGIWANSVYMHMIVCIRFVYSSAGLPLGAVRLWHSLSWFMILTHNRYWTLLGQQYFLGPTFKGCAVKVISVHFILGILTSLPTQHIQL